MADTAKTWLAAYLYYAEPWEEFLTKAVKPFVQYIFDRRLAEQFFFIRYWERGPHIRLRIKGDNHILENEIKPELNDRFQKYYQQNPSHREEPEWLENLPEEQQWFANDSIQYIEYEPEIERYGGPVGQLISESQFELSSRVTLDIIEETQQWSYDRALGAAMQLHLVFAAAMKMDLMETQAFYNYIFLNRFASAYGYHQSLSTKERKDLRGNTLKAFEDNFNKQKSRLIPFHKTLWQALAMNYEFEQEWLNLWIGGMERICNNLRKAQKENYLIFPDWFKTDAKNVPEARQKLWFILESYAHMTNNRLGIFNHDEAFLGYLITKSLEHL